MSANPNAATGGSTIVTIQGSSQGSGAPIPVSSYANNQASSAPTANSTGASDPITITRRINVKIQGSMSDFAQDGQGCATWRPVDGKQAAIWGLQVCSLSGPKVWLRHVEHLIPACFSPRISPLSVEIHPSPPMAMLHPPMHPLLMLLAMPLSNQPFSSSTSLLSRSPLELLLAAFLPMR